MSISFQANDNKWWWWV